MVFARSNDGGNPEIPYECQLELRRDMPYDEVVRRLGRHVGCDPKNILLRLPDYYGIPNRPIKPTDTMTLLDILLQSPKSKTLGRRHEDNNGFLLSKVYFQVLSMDLSVYQSKKLVKFNIVYPSLQENSRYMEFCVPKTSTIKDVAHNIFPKSVVRIYEIAKDKFVREFRPEETVGVCIDDEAELCAEVRLFPFFCFFCARANTIIACVSSVILISSFEKKLLGYILRNEEEGRNGREF